MRITQVIVTDENDVQHVWEVVSGEVTLRSMSLGQYLVLHALLPPNPEMSQS
jgi:hypothetical protein